MTQRPERILFTIEDRSFAECTSEKTFPVTLCTYSGKNEYPTHTGVENVMQPSESQTTIGFYLRTRRKTSNRKTAIGL